MKKLLVFCSLLAVMGGSIALADDLANVSLNYCDTAENVLQYQIDPAAETGICYTLSNNAKSAVTVKVGFIDGTFTNDQRQNKACLSDTDIENFGQYVTDYDQFITLKPGETITKTAKLRYPQGMDGLYHGCIVYSVVDSTKNVQSSNTSFSILMRRAKFIDVIVGNPENAKEKGIVLDAFTDEEGDNLSRNPRIRIYKDAGDNSYMIQLKVRNISAVEQDVVITGVVSNLLVYKHTFIESRKILKGESLLITQKLENSPSYDLALKLNISNTPFTFNGETPVIGTTKEKTTIWIWNTITFLTIAGILIVAGIIFLLVKDLRKRGNDSDSHAKKRKSNSKKSK